MICYDIDEDGHVGVPMMPIGPGGEGGLDDAPGGNEGSGGGASLQQDQRINADDLDAVISMNHYPVDDEEGIPAINWMKQLKSIVGTGENWFEEEEKVRCVQGMRWDARLF